MEPPRCGVCHETIEGIIACPKCMAPIHSGCADFKGDGPCGITYACDGSTGDGSKGENTLGRSDQADSKDAQFMMVHEAYERVKRYQLKPQSIFMWYRRWITSSISEKEGIEYIAWKLAQPSATYQEVNFSGGLMSRWVGQCHEFWSGEGRSDSGVNNELVSARLAKGLLRFDDRNDSRTSCLVSFYPSAYEQVVKDLITVGTYPAAMGIASESEILPLIKKASYCIGTAYQQMDDKKSWPWAILSEAGTLTR